MDTINQLLDIPLPYNKIQFLFNDNSHDFDMAVHLSTINFKDGRIFPVFEGIIKQWLKFFIVLELVKIIPNFILFKIETCDDLIATLKGYDITWQDILEQAYSELYRSFSRILVTYSWFNKFVKLRKW